MRNQKQNQAGNDMSQVKDMINSDREFNKQFLVANHSKFNQIETPIKSQLRTQTITPRGKELKGFFRA